MYMVVHGPGLCHLHDPEGLLACIHRSHHGDATVVSVATSMNPLSFVFKQTKVFFTTTIVSGVIYTVHVYEDGAHTLFFKILFMNNCIVPMGFLPREIRVASPGESQLGQSRYPTCGACWMFQCFRNPWNSDMDYGIFNVCTDVNACDCT